MGTEKNTIMEWLDRRLPVTENLERHLTKHPVPKKVNFFYLFGALLMVVFMVQVITGIWLMMFYTNTEEGHGHDPSHGIMHKDEYALAAGDVILAEEGDYVKVINESDHDQLVYLRIFDKAGWRGRSPGIDKDPQSK